MRIKTLDTHRKARKIELEQIWREGPFAIFKEVGKDRNYEVIRIHTRQPREAWGETQDWDLIEVNRGARTVSRSLLCQRPGRRSKS